ncbi:MULTISPECIES: helix-turn-helix domain-containing protein [unclassified Paenibacillus]|uniref:helix-turn-helix domain-containing protein n=1 Tax=unclassified Paenibacillus TaxID=185978 RepID=UPI001AE99663|nr:MULTISPECIES: helix-turn-helix domain-containing protein [unclassified Paenibacillus]MBP1153930.1 transcriptional regulator with XRE-family HTH domain [Paenibacillus sp. PvP091]MBP1170685.1 transcriptional regulator with XRE-family HTH domain [Paenibacillus sp. PvR098]MBP2441713.1 transcriptional regulator with XRE-family HTH domain [Paenibacillus sp. PvP052]
MAFTYYEHQEAIAKKLIALMRQRGCSRLSLSILSGILRPAIDQLLNGGNSNVIRYNSQILQINQAFDLPADYFLKNECSSALHVLTLRTPEAQDLLDGLDNILDIYSMYLVGSSDYYQDDEK